MVNTKFLGQKIDKRLKIGRTILNKWFLS